MNMKNVFTYAMNGTFDLSDMLNKINTHHVEGNLTDTDREELMRAARSKADPMGGVDIKAMLMEHETRIKELEAQIKTGGSVPDAGTGVESIAEYVPGKWYRKGDKVYHNGAVCVCTVPDGQVCVWSPDEYPDYWEIT